MKLTPNNTNPVATSFAVALDALCQSHVSADHCIGDAQMQVCYKDLPSYFKAIDIGLQTEGIEREDCVAFECQNTTAALIVLLALLYRGQHMLLLPPQDSPLKEPGFKPDIPQFCKTHMTVGAMDPSIEFGPQAIIHWLNLYPHQAFDIMAWKRLDLTRRRLLLRTSGSMGTSKIVLFSHNHLLANAANCMQRFGLQRNSRVTIAVPVFHMYGFGAAFIPCLLAGASIDVQANTNILRFMEHERRFNPDVVYLNPTLCAMLLKGRRQSKLFARTISAGDVLLEPLYHDYREQFGLLTNLYGSTEMGAIATASALSRDDQPTHLTPLPDVEFEIDPDDNALHCLHPYGFDGYINDQGQPVVSKTSPYKTGDAARLLDDGRFELMGRQDSSTNRGGFLVQFRDIETALLKTGQVAQTHVACGQENSLRGQKLYAYCLAERGAHTDAITAESIRQRCFDYLPRYAIPDEIILLKNFPLLANGKVDRQTLNQSITNKDKELFYE